MRKKLGVCLMAVMMALFSVCAGAETVAYLREMPAELRKVYSGSQPQSITKSGKTLKVRLKGNPTTGYDWSAEVKDPGILKLTKTAFVADAHKAQEAGYGGTCVFRFKGLSKGTTVITFTYARSWESDHPASTCKVKVTVKANGKIASAIVLE